MPHSMHGTNGNEPTTSPSAGWSASDGHNRGSARGTDAVKLSAKLFTALAAIALLVVALVGTPEITQATHEGPAHGTGTVELTNKWSKLTTKTGGFSTFQVTGAGSTTDAAEKAVSGTLYSTFIEKNVAGTAIQSVEANSNVVIVSVLDSDRNKPVTKTATTTWDGTSSDEGKSVNLGSLAGTAAVPIIDSDGDGLFNDEVTITNSAALAGAGLNVADWTVAVDNATTGLIRIFSVSSTSNTVVTGAGILITWKTSAADTVSVNLKSTSDTTGVTVTASETGRNTGVFRVEVTLIDAEPTGASSSSTTKKLIALHNSTVTATYTDKSVATPAAAEATAAQATKVTNTLTVETNAPQATIALPANTSATQDQTPAFSGSIIDTGGSGLDVSVKLYIDDDADATNATAVEIASGDAFTPGIAVGAKDGDSTVTWSFTPSAALPTGIATPDHLVDFQIRSNDMAGNVGFSDADNNPDDNFATSTDLPDAPGEGTVADPGRGQPHVIRIDRAIPSISSAYTGHKWDTAVDPAVRKADDATRIEVLFDGPMDGTSIDNTDFEVVIVTTAGSTTHVPTVAELFAKVPASVFLTIGTSIPSDNKPTVKIVNPVADTAGNTTNSGSKVAFDSLSPVVTLTLSGGSSATAPTTLTKDKMVATVTSDESLGSIKLKVSNASAVLEATITPVAQGGNVWKSTISAVSSGLTEGKLSVVAEATDLSTADPMDFNNDGDVVDAADTGVAPNTKTHTAVKYTYDKTAPTVTVTPTGTANNDRSPFVTLTYLEVVVIDKAEFNGADVKATLATVDSKKYILVTSDLALQAHKVVARATDLAGNKSAEETKAFTIIARADFKLALSAGWNAKSIPSPAVDPSIDNVFSNAQIDQVLAFDATDAANPWRIATKDAGSFTSTTETPLTSIETGNGYWVHTDNFETQLVALTGAVGPGSGTPPAVVTIATAEGWNFIGVVDPSRAKTTGAESTFTTSDKYFSSVNQQRVFTYDANVPNFSQKAGSDSLSTGQGVWVFISKQSDGSLPDIVPPAE